MIEQQRQHLSTLVDGESDPALVRNDEAIDYNWGAGAPAVGLPADGFSARWTRQIWFEPGVYRFAAWADDLIRVYVDGELLIDAWHSWQDDVYTANLAPQTRRSCVTSSVLPLAALKLTTLAQSIKRATVPGAMEQPVRPGML